MVALTKGRSIASLAAATLALTLLGLPESAAPDGAPSTRVPSPSGSGAPCGLTPATPAELSGSRATGLAIAPLSKWRIRGPAKSTGEIHRSCEIHQ